MGGLPFIQAATEASSKAASFCLHPTLPVVAVAIEGTLAEYDLLSGCKLGSTETADSPVVFQYTADATTIVGLTQDKALIAWETQFWKRKVLVHALDKALIVPLLTIAQGTRPPIFVSAKGSKEVVMVATQASSDPKSRDRQLTFEVKKSVVAIAAHPVDAAVLFQAHDDGSISAGTVSISQRSYNLVWNVSVPGNFASAQASLAALRHPERIDDILLLLKTSESITALETIHGEPNAPFLFHQPEGGSTIGGACYNPVTRQLLCYLRGTDDEITSESWVLGSQSEGTELTASKLQNCSTSMPLSGSKPDKRGWQESWLPKAFKESQCDDSVWEILPHQRSDVLLCVKRAAWGVTATAVPLRTTSLPMAPAPTTATVIHTGLDYWAGKGDGVQQHLPIASTILYLEQNSMKAFSIMEGKAETLISFTSKLDAGSAYQARSLMHSIKQNFVVVFLQKTIQKADEKDPSIGFEFTAFSLSGGDQIDLKLEWSLPGASGAFIGADEERYVIYDASSQRVALYQSTIPDPRRLSRSKPKIIRPQPLSQLTVLGRNLHQIFSGPSWMSLPRSGEGEVETPSSGLVMWSAPEKLSLGEFASIGSSHRAQGGYAYGGSSAAAAAYSLGLDIQESVLQVAWQDLLTANAEGSVLDDTGEGKASTVGAVLTTKRLLLVSVTMKVLVTLSIGTDEAAISSILWMGPALLFSNQSNQIKQLSWDGSVIPFCSIGGGASTALVAALADRLIVARGGALAHRKVSVLGPLLLGWASLAAMGILPGGIWRARSEMGKLARLHDSSRISASLLGTLLTAGCADVALALARNDKAHQLPTMHQAAMNAAAGQWQPALQAVREAHQQTMYYPNPPPKGSLLWKRQVTLGRTALAYGQISAARECWQAANHWEQALPLYSLQGDFSSIRRAIPAAKAEASVLGEQLLQGNEGRFSRVSAVGAKTLSGDWRVAPEPLSGSLADAAAEVALQFPVSQSALQMQVTLSDEAGRTVTVPPLETSTLLTYIGVDISNPWKVPSTARKDSLFKPLSMVGTAESSGAVDRKLDSILVDQPVPSTSKSPLQSLDSATAGLSHPANATGESAMKVGDDFDSDSADEAASETSAPSRLQFKIVIRDKSDQAAKDDGDALRQAASSLRLPPSLFPSPPPGQQRIATKPAMEENMLAPLPPPVLRSTEGRTALPEDLFSSPAFASDGKMAVEPTEQSISTTAAAISNIHVARVGGDREAEAGTQKSTSGIEKVDPKSAFLRGVKSMEQGDWEEARGLFSAALHAPETAKEKRPQVAQYLTAVRLLEAQRDNPDKSASLSRFAAALNLQEKHKHALVQNAAHINMEAGNYGYTAEQLLWLVTQTVNKAPQEFLIKLQETITICEKKGSKNASINPDEDLQSFTDIIGAATSVAEVDSCIEPILME